MTKVPRKGRSAVTNGTRLFLEPVLDGVEYRRFADLLASVEAERGGRAAMSVTQQAAARQFVSLVILTERMHCDLVAGRPVDMEALGQLGDRADRQARRMGPVKAETRRSVLERLTGAR